MMKNDVDDVKDLEWLLFDVFSFHSHEKMLILVMLLWMMMIVVVVVMPRILLQVVVVVGYLGTLQGEMRQ